jgi:hypothetical protein
MPKHIQTSQFQLIASKRFPNSQKPGKNKSTSRCKFGKRSRAAKNIHLHHGYAKLAMVKFDPKSQNQSIEVKRICKCLSGPLKAKNTFIFHQIAF